jgi:peptidoglycan/xylan/chitin deacetylase (PgdA/CDA1 family)
MNAHLGRPVLAVLAFHKIGQPPTLTWRNPWYIPEATFRGHLRYLSSNGWEVISVDTFLRALSAPECLPQRAALLTFDDGYKSLLKSASACLREFGYPSVVFVPTHFVGGHNDFDRGQQPEEEICTWDDLRELANHGFSIQSHGVRHVPLPGLTQDQKEEELGRSRSIIEAELGKPVEVFAYPYGHVCPDERAVSKLLKRSGYRAAFRFGGGIAALPLGNAYFLPRVDMYPWSDLTTLLGTPK